MDGTAILGWVLIGVVLFGVFYRLRQRSQAKVKGKPSATAATPAKPLTVAQKLQALRQPLDVQAEKTTHPRELLTFPEFQNAAAILADPSCELDVVRQYAVGRLWTLACAAFEALRTRPDRQAMLGAAMGQLHAYPPGTLHFMLRYLESLENRPLVGEPLTVAQPWWAGHAMLTESFREYFTARQALGDPATFGEALNRASVQPDNIEAFLASMDHPMAAALLAQLRTWRAGRIDTRSLSAFGRFWSQAGDELLVEPAAWKEPLERAEQALMGSAPRSILVTGPSRVGKTSFLRLLGERLEARGWRVFESSAAELMAGQMYIGQIEGRVRQLIDSLNVGKRVVWCGGDLWQLARGGAHQGQAATILDQVWPSVADGKLVMLTEADPDGASRVLQSRPPLRMRLEVIRLEPLDEAGLSSLAHSVAQALEAQGAPPIAPAVQDAALSYALQYLQAGEAPGAVADVLKRAAQRAEAARAKALTVAQVIEAVSQMTGLPADILSDDAPVDLAAMRAFFAERVIGQDEAIATVVDRVAMLKAGLVDPSKPIGVFLFAGPTGTGKTELAKTLAAFLFGSADRLIRLDMSEFQTGEAVSKIVGERGIATGSDPLVERIRKQPFSVLLLDEFEKAHPGVWDLFLQVFDDGRLADANGKAADFRHAIIILTSNLGAAAHRSAGIGFTPAKDVFTEDQVMAAVERAFRPEFINRLDRIVVFKPLSRELMYKILRKELADILERRGLRNREWAVEWEPSALDFLLDRGFSSEMGARPLKRAIDHYLLAPLAASLVEHRFPQGDQFLFVRSNGKAIEVEFLDPNADAAETASPDAEAAPASNTLSLEGLILRPQGDAAARAFLQARRRDLAGRLDSPEWAALKTRLTKEAQDPEIWRRPDRAVVFGGLNVMDRVREAASTVERLGRRLESGAGGEPGARDLVARLALQLCLTDAGVTDALTGAPDEAALLVEAVLDGGEDDPASTWSRRLASMYSAWAERRRMQFELVAHEGPDPPILLASGFGAYRTLLAEAGLHVFDHPAGAPLRREVARVRVIAGPSESADPAKAKAGLMARFAAAGEDRAVVRRYREAPAPLVRDSASGQRTGNLDQVLGGDFDLVFAASMAREAAPAPAAAAGGGD